MSFHCDDCSNPWPVCESFENHYSFFLTKEDDSYMVHYFHNDAYKDVDGVIRFDGEMHFAEKIVDYKEIRDFAICFTDDGSMLVFLLKNKVVGEIKFSHWRYGNSVEVGVNYDKGALN